MRPTIFFKENENVEDILLKAIIMHEAIAKSLCKSSFGKNQMFNFGIWNTKYDINEWLQYLY